MSTSNARTLQDTAVRYLAGFEVDFRDKKSATLFLATQGVDRKGFDFFVSVQCGLELHMKKNRIARYFEVRGKDADRTLKGENIELPLGVWEDHTIFFLEKMLGGKHRIGGGKPGDLLLPVHRKLKTLFQYIGTLDCTEKLFEWMHIPKLDIVYPLFECNSGVYLDYSVPGRVEILNPETFSDAWYQRGTENLEVEFAEVRYSATERIDSEKFEGGDKLLCGVPLWYQQPEIPICPKSGKVMKFACTINSDREAKILGSRGTSSLPFGDYLCFGDHGHLFVFFQPETKVVHLKTQW